jgi:hypothetical protein
MKYLVMACCAAWLFASCGNNANESVALDDAGAEAESVVIGDTNILRFDQVDVYVTGLQIGTLSEGLKVVRESMADTVEMNLDLEQSLENAHMYVCEKGTQHTMVSDMFESQVNVLSIQNEGPHLDLGNWKTYVSGYSSLEPLGNEHYRPLRVDYEHLKFPSINYVALIKHIDSLDDADKSWVALLRQMKQKDSTNASPVYPVSVGIGERWIRIEGKVRGENFTKWIKFTLPQGC